MADNDRRGQKFDVAIYADDKTTADWRTLHDAGAARFKHETFPSDQRDLCFKYLKKFGLKFGAFDFVETPDGQIVFLECNPNGQYAWFEQELTLPISAAIVSELASIAAG